MGLPTKGKSALGYSVRYQQRPHSASPMSCRFSLYLEDFELWYLAEQLCGRTPNPSFPETAETLRPQVLREMQFVAVCLVISHFLRLFSF